MVGIESIISFDIKPRTTNALVLSVHGKRAMFALQLINGTINFTVDNGRKINAIVFHPKPNETLFDGEWHKVTAVKSQYGITLIVDSWQSTIDTNYSIDTTRPLFIGGHPYLTKVRGLTVRSSFIGCISNIQINDDNQPITESMANGDVRVGVCVLK